MIRLRSTLISKLALILVLCVLFAALSRELNLNIHLSNASIIGGGMHTVQVDSSVKPEKGDPKLGSRLNQLILAHAQGSANAFALDTNIMIVGESVRVIIECNPEQVDAVVSAASAVGVVEARYRHMLQVLVPIHQLETLAGIPSIQFIRAPWYPSLQVYSEGVEVIGATQWQTAGYTGEGVKVAVLDTGFTGYADLLGTELPASVITKSFYEGSGIEGDTDHGTACAEVLYDIAPGAEFYLVSFGTIVEMGDAVDWIIAQGIDVISCSFAWPIGGPGDGTGVICEMVDNAHAAGISWAQAVGNSSQQHWQGSFVDTDGDDAHEFTGADMANTISVNNGDRILIGIKWGDLWGSSANDYDLFLYDNNGDVAAMSNGTQDGDNDPWEYISYPAKYTGDYHIVISRNDAPSPATFHLYSNQELEYRTASSSYYVPADSPKALAVGAVHYGAPSQLEGFSSRGPAINGKIVPDIVAPDGVSTATYGMGGFYGTSASTPHVAGTVALIVECYPDSTPDDIKAFLEERAVDLGDNGKDNLFGSGRIDLGDVPSDEDSASNILLISGSIVVVLALMGTLSYFIWDRRRKRKAMIVV